MNDIIDLFKITGKGKQFIYLILLRSPISALQTVLLAKFLQYAFLSIDRKSMNDLYISCIYFGIGCFVLFLYNGSIWTVFAAFTIRWECILRRKLFKHISGISLQEIEAKSSGDWFTRMNSDIKIASGGPNHLSHIIMPITSICSFAIILLLMNPAIFMLVILFLIPHVLLSTIFIARPMTMLSIKSQVATAKNATDMNTLISSAEIMILYDAHDHMLKQFEESSLNIRKINMKIVKRNAFGGMILLMMGMSGFLVILILGGIWISSGNMTFGELAAAFQYRNGLFAGTIMLVSSIISLKAALAGVRRYNETMQTQLEG